MQSKEEKLPFFGMVFVVTGETETPREDLVARIRELGGKVTLSISKNTTYLLAGKEPGPSKMKKALDLGTKIISESDFVAITKDYIVQPQEVTREVTQLSNEKWIDKHRPQSISELGGNSSAADQVKVFLMALNRKPLIIAGPSGVGKTLSVYLVAKELGITLIEYNGADCRNKAEIANLSVFSAQQTLTVMAGMHRNKVILLEEIDTMGANDRGGLNEILTLFKQTKVPIIMTVNDKTNPKIKSILPKCKVIVFQKLDSRTIINTFKKIVTKEKISIADNTLAQIAAVCGGDMRYAINALQCLCQKGSISTEDIKALGKELTTTNLFDTTRTLFTRNTSIDRRMKAFYSDTLLSLMMVHENYQESLISLSSAANTADSLSQAEILSSQVFYQGEKNLFPIAAYYTCIKPELRLSTRINFTKYLGFSTTKEAKYKKIARLLNHFNTGGVFTSRSLHHHLAWLATFIADKKVLPAAKSRLIQQLQIDKEDFQLIADLTNTKLSTAKIVFPHNWDN
ncbi:replication factor C subunit 1 [Nematocida homosporus]|uniref:replication factor C subunit 1 n=1 Tax=Nematocida homosporus TaxID=1912981 RepID=UPI00221F0243|nr:replication factor C subunit 1 [Nematocida homosporus]KAI5186252.1 replication factor C subunit 1 [Nematocida homosporus]